MRSGLPAAGAKSGLAAHAQTADEIRGESSNESAPTRPERDRCRRRCAAWEDDHARITETRRAATDVSDQVADVEPGRQ